MGIPSVTMLVYNLKREEVTRRSSSLFRLYTSIVTEGMPIVIRKNALTFGCKKPRYVLTMVTIKTVVVNVFLPSLSLRLVGIKALGYHMAKPAIITQRMAISSSNC